MRLRSTEGRYHDAHFHVFFTQGGPHATYSVGEVARGMYLKAGDDCPAFLLNSPRLPGLDRARPGGKGEGGVFSGESEVLNKRSKLHWGGKKTNQ